MSHDSDKHSAHIDGLRDAIALGGGRTEVSLKITGAGVAEANPKAIVRSSKGQLQLRALRAFKGSQQ